jgi:hypothetical protein
MSRPWLDGDLSGVDPRAELSLLRDAVHAAVLRGEPVDRLVAALAAVDPVACAELVAGARAVAHPGAVRAALGVAPILERVVAPAGLYHRLADLAPDAAADVLATAVARHGEAGWLAALCRRVEPVPGTAWLDATRGGPAFSAAVRRCAEAGLVDGLVAAAAVGDELEIVAALTRVGDLSGALDAGAAALRARPDAPVVEVIAAVRGPELGAVLRGLLDRLGAHPSALAVRRRFAPGAAPSGSE